MGLLLALLLVLAGCRQHGDAPAPVPVAAPGPRDAAAAPIDAAPAFVELLHRSGASVAVSSRVANASIDPHDLVDGHVTTAWNSKTGDLAGAWIAFRVPAAAHVKAIRMTVGFTQGEYFTQNHRVKTVRVLSGDRELARRTLDVASQALQEIPVDAPGGDFKIVLDELVPGTKKDWREAAVSELEVWGTPAPGSQPADPDVVVGSLDAEPPDDGLLNSIDLPAYASVEAYCKELLARPPPECEPWDGNCHHGGTPACPVAAAPPSGSPATLQWFVSKLSGRTSCNVAITAPGGKRHVLADVAGEDCGEPTDMGDGKSRQIVEIHDGLLVLVTAAYHHSMLDMTTTTDENLWVCDVTNPACVGPLTIGRSSYKEVSGGEPGADGVEYVPQENWRLDYKLAGRRLVVTRRSGKLADEAKGLLGSHRLQF